MRNLAVAIIRILLFLLVWALLVYVANRVLTYLPDFASLTGAPGALVRQLCVLIAAAIASLLFGFIDSDAHNNGALSLGWPRLGWVGGYVILAAVLPAAVLVASGAGSFDAAGVVTNRGIVSGLGMGIELGVGEAHGAAANPLGVDGIVAWVLYLVALAATLSLVSFGYVFSVAQARAGDAVAVGISLLVYLGVGISCIPASAFGALMAVAVGLMLALIALEAGGILAPFLVNAVYLIVARLGFGVVLTPEACPSLLPLKAEQTGSLFGLLTIYPNITLVFFVCTCLALALAAVRAWRTRP